MPAPLLVCGGTIAAHRHRRAWAEPSDLVQRWEAFATAAPLGPQAAAPHARPFEVARRHLLAEAGAGRQVRGGCSKSGPPGCPRSHDLGAGHTGARGKMALDTTFAGGYTPAMTPTSVKRIRRELGLTQEQLAREIGVDRVTVARWELGLRAIPEPTARLIRLLHAGARGTAKGKRKGRAR